MENKKAGVQVLTISGMKEHLWVGLVFVMYMKLQALTQQTRPRITNFCTNEEHNLCYKIQYIVTAKRRLTN